MYSSKLYNDESLSLTRLRMSNTMSTEQQSSNAITIVLLAVTTFMADPGDEVGTGVGSGAEVGTWVK